MTYKVLIEMTNGRHVEVPRVSQNDLDGMHKALSKEFGTITITSESWSHAINVNQVVEIASRKLNNE